MCNVNVLGEVCNLYLGCGFNVAISQIEGISYNNVNFGHTFLLQGPAKVLLQRA